MPPDKLGIRLAASGQSLRLFQPLGYWIGVFAVQPLQADHSPEPVPSSAISPRPEMAMNQYSMPLSQAREGDHVGVAVGIFPHCPHCCRTAKTNAWRHRRQA